MAAENAPIDNVTLGNGNVPRTAEPSTPKETPSKTPEHFLMTIILTIYDVIMFLGISIGIIFQVSILFEINQFFSSIKNVPAASNDL